MAKKKLNIKPKLPKAGGGGKLKYLPPDVSRPSMIDPFTGESKSEYKMGFEVGGKEVTLPTVWQDPPFVNASQHSGDEAFQRFKDTGEHMGIHNTWQEGDIDAWRRTAKYNFLSNPVESSSSGEFTSYPKLEYKNGGLLKAQNGLNTPIKGTKEQYYRWRDSSDLNLYTNLQHQLEPSWSVIQGNALQNLGIGQDSEFAKNQHRLFNTADSLIRNNSNLEWGTYGDPFADSKGQNSLREQYSSKGGNSPDIRSKGNVIKPANFWTGSAANHDYIQPVQPIIYQPDLQQIAQNPNPSRVTPSTTQTYQGLQQLRPKEQPIQLKRKEAKALLSRNSEFSFYDGYGNELPKNTTTAEYLQKYGLSYGDTEEELKQAREKGVVDDISYCDDCQGEKHNLSVPGTDIKFRVDKQLSKKTNLNFNPIPFKPGSYFTRPIQNQENTKDNNIGKLEYFDSKTGKKLKNGGSLGEWEIVDDLPKFQNAGLIKKAPVNPASFQAYQQANPAKGTPTNPVILPEVNITAPRAQYPTELGKRLQYSRDENQKLKDAAAEEMWSNSYKGEQGLGNDIIGEQIGFGALAKSLSSIKPIASELTGIGKNAIQNTYKINPWAFKPQEGMMYRGLGKEGMEDALQSGVFRAKQNIEPIMDNGFDMSKKFNSTYYSPKFEVADSYGKGFIAEVPKSASDFRLRYKGGKGSKQWSQIADENIPIEKGKILKKDWLQGYKEVSQPASNFKSEIDWSKWDVAAKDNPDVVKHLNDIERTTKANGSWMKNTDGTPFKGDPEEFIVMQSDNFKKAFPKGVDVGYRGAHQHIDDFANRERDDWATFLTSDLENAKAYGRDANGRFFTPNESPHEWKDGIYKLAIPKDSPRVIGTAEGKSWRLANWDEKIALGTKNKDFANFHNDNLKDFFNKNQLKEYGIEGYNPSKKYLSTDAYAQYVKNPNNPEAIAQIDNVVDTMGDIHTKPTTVHAVDSKRVNLKSLRHNIMFDMTNPNIYKGLIPPALGIGIASQQEKKFGGNVNTDWEIVQDDNEWELV
tara:strand:+ start:36842 stop:39934 length:3093 start_codon:yes stop_codon:yes gene_type:complete